MTKFLGFAAAGVLVMVAAAGSARAGTVTLSNLTFPYGDQTVTLNYTGADPTGPYNNPNGQPVYAGEVNILVNGGPPSINAFCTDIFNDWASGSSYTAQTISSGSGFNTGNNGVNNGQLTTAQYTALLELLNGVNSTHYITNASNQSLASAAVQVAVWEITNETVTPYDVSAGSGSGVFWITNNSSVETTTNSLLGDLGTTGWNNGTGTLTEYVPTTGNQDFTLLAVTGNTNQVPEPASLALLGTGLAGFAALRRRRGRA